MNSSSFKALIYILKIEVKKILLISNVNKTKHTQCFKLLEKCTSFIKKKLRFCILEESTKKLLYLIRFFVLAAVSKKEAEKNLDEFELKFLICFSSSPLSFVLRFRALFIAVSLTSFPNVRCALVRWHGGSGRTSHNIHIYKFTAGLSHTLFAQTEI